MKAKTRKPQKPRPGYFLAEHNPELMSEYYFEVFCKDQQPTIETIDSVVHKII